jgi:NAD(P)-dependent dehydrogenase (short-subunit alcohol dehydrogenase family)
MNRIETPFGRTSSAAEVVDGINLLGRRAVVTGAASGIGVETARALAQAGADVTLAVRDVAAGERTALDIVRSTGNQQLHVARLDLADRDSIDAFTENWWGPLHLLVNNAGVMACPEQHTAEGWELQLATNHLGHFALALGLQEALAVDGHARIVSLSSSAHLRSPVVFDDLHFERREYDPWLAYGQSKTANVLFAVEATRRWAQDGITANAVMPGGIMTNLQRHISQDVIDGWREGQRNGTIMQFKTPEQGAATSVLVATAPQLEGVGGRYFEDCNEAVLVPDDHESRDGVRAYALDPRAAERLWDVSLEMLNTQVSATA